MAAILKIDITS